MEFVRHPAKVHVAGPEKDLPKVFFTHVADSQ
jgi:hypothetical protein